MTAASPPGLGRTLEDVYVSFPVIASLRSDPEFHDAPWVFCAVNVESFVVWQRGSLRKLAMTAASPP